MKKLSIICSLLFMLCMVSFINSCSEKKTMSFEDFVRSKTSDTIFLNHVFSNEKLKSMSLHGESISIDEVRPPKFPFKHFFTQLPDNDSTKKYIYELDKYFDYKKRLETYIIEYKHYLKTTTAFASDPEGDYIGQKTYSWNGDIFWAPASKTNDDVNRSGDEVRAVFGQIPTFDVSKLGKFTNSDGSTVETVNLGLQVDGFWVKLKPNISKPGSPLEFEFRDIDGNFIKWEAMVSVCDKPSLAGGVTPCGTSSRLSVIIKGNVEWIALARKTHREEILKAENYWLESDMNYELVGYIGFNRSTGELAFFDGSYNGQKFTYDKSIVAPGGSGYTDDAGRTTAALMYDPLHRIDCAGCHDNKEPRIVTPYIKQARVGFSDARRAISFSVGKILPYFGGNKDSKPYRVIGTGYNSVNSQTISEGRTIVDPSGNCTSCHSLTNLGTGFFALDAVAKNVGANTIEKFRSNWALRSGAGKIHPWMLPEDGNVLDQNTPGREITDAEWQALSKLIQDPNSGPGSRKLYTSAPAPESSVATELTRITDPSTATNFKGLYASNPDNDNSLFPQQIAISWNYLNQLGGVLNRDDVRFNIAISETEISGTNPMPTDYPTIEQTKGDIAQQITGNVYKINNMIIIKDISFVNHKKFTDALISTTPRDYAIRIPAKNNKRYLITIVAKRFTFDNEVIKYSDLAHNLFIDTKITTAYLQTLGKKSQL